MAGEQRFDATPGAPGQQWPPAPAHAGPPAGAAPTGAPPSSKRWIVPALACGLVAVVAVVLGGLYALGSSDDGGSPEDVAVEWIEAFQADDAGAVYDTLVPEQRAVISSEAWASCGYAIVDDDNDVEQEDDFVNGSVEVVSEPYQDDTVMYSTNQIPGDGDRRSKTHEVIVRVTAEDGAYGTNGAFYDFTASTVERDGDWYIWLNRDWFFDIEDACT